MYCQSHLALISQLKPAKVSLSSPSFPLYSDWETQQRIANLAFSNVSFDLIRAMPAMKL